MARGTRRRTKSAAEEQPVEAAEAEPYQPEAGVPTAEEQGAQAIEDTHGGEEGAAEPSPQATGEEGGEEGGEKPKRKSKTIHDRRAEIYASMKTRVGEDSAAEEGEPAPLEEGEQPAEEPEQRKFKIKVDKRELEVTESDLIAAAQVGYAQEDRLRELNDLKRLSTTQQQEMATLLAEVRAFRQSQSGERDSPSNQRRETAPAAEARETPTKAREVDKERLGAVVDELQFGDRDKAVEALAALFSEIPPSDEGAFNADELADQVIQRVDSRQRLASAADAFSTAHPEIAADPDLQHLTARAMHRHAIQEMVAYCDAHNLPREQLQPAMQDPGTAFRWHADYRREQAPGFSSYDDIVSTATAEIGRKAGIVRYAGGAAPAPAPTGGRPAPAGEGSAQRPGASMEARHERKEEMAPQPRRAAVVAPRGETQQGGNRPRPALTTIADQMRQARGRRPIHSA